MDLYRAGRKDGYEHGYKEALKEVATKKMGFTFSIPAIIFTAAIVRIGWELPPLINKLIIYLIGLIS